MTTHVLQVLRLAQPIAQRNAHVLDHISAPPTATTPPSTTPPISKYILSTLFKSLERREARNVFVENDQENHFLYGLVLPLIARLLAVSTPGLVCIVQLPRIDTLPEWALPPPFDAASNGSNGSKSAAPTTLSPQGTSRTPSPSDEHATPRKSVSPDAHPGTAELIRHADKLLSGAEAAADAVRDERSPPPNSVMEDHRALRLICNGFEVLTGKMPPPRVDMGSFTLASVGWEKAGIVSPEDNAKGVSMSFSNGMMTPTEGIVVTFSNGSMVFLTLRDPLSMIHSLKISDVTPVVVFSFCSVGQKTVADLLNQKKDSLGEEASRVRATVERENVFVLEIGHGVSDTSGGAPEREVGDDCVGRPPAPSPNAPAEKSTIRTPPVPISAIPRAVPLFVNTINQTFIDAPYYSQEKTEQGVDDALLTHTDGEGKTSNEPIREQCNAAAGDARQEHDTATHCQNNTQRTARVDPPVGSKSLSTKEQNACRGDVVQTSTPASAAATKVPVTSSVPNVDASSHNPESVPPPHGHPSMYNYYGYGHGHGSVYQADNTRPHQVMAHRPLVPVTVHQNQPRIPAPHGYYHQAPPVQTGPHQPNSHGGYHPHHPGPPYAPGSYYAMPSPGLMHQAPPGNSQWHGVHMPHAPPPLPPPHPLDARRDMPIHFSSHHAVASTMDAQYPPHYYPPPSNNRHVYPRQPNSVVPDGTMHADISRLSSQHGKSTNQVEAIRHATEGPDPRIGHAGYVPQSLEDSKAKATGPQFLVPDAKDVPRDKCTASRECELKDRESREMVDRDNADKTALEALVRIGEGGNEKKEAIKSDRWMMNDPRHGGKRRDHSMLGSEHQMSTGVEEKTCAARNRSECISEMGAKGKNRSTPTRARPSTRTNSSTSTNSQGGALVKGAITGNSHMSGHASYSGSQPQQKRARQR